MAAHKIYVLDTCVLLHDPHALYKFEEHDVYIPLAVIDDLDEIKTRRESVAWAAREVFRQIDLFSINDLVKGVKVNSKHGRLFIYNTQAPLRNGETPTITRVNSDNALIEVCLQLKAKFPKRTVCLVTKDVGLRIRAASFNVLAENYRNDMLDAEIYKGFTTVNVGDKQIITQIYANQSIGFKEAKELVGNSLVVPHNNEFVIFKYDDSCSVACIYKKGEFHNCFDKSKKISYMGLTPRNLEQKLSVHVLADDNIPLVSLVGKAGSGKTILSLAVGLHKILVENVYDKLVVIKPLMPVGGKEIGYLPGDKFSKIVAWLGPIRDNLEQLVNTTNDKISGVSMDLEEMCEKGIIEVEALTFIQGRSIPNAFIICDENENLNPRETRMLVERCGKNSKVVLLGDLTQIENPYLDQYSCGLTHVIEGSKDSDLAASVELHKVERSPLSAAASEIFKKGFSGNT